MQSDQNSEVPLFPFKENSSGETKAALDYKGLCSSNGKDKFYYKNISLLNAKTTQN